MNREQLESIISETVKKQLEQAAATEIFLTPEQLCERWKVSMRCLEKWRLEGKPPAYMKVQKSQRAIIRYPLHGEGGIIDIERTWLQAVTPRKGGKNG